MLNLQMAFPDGVFHYACSECDALCCRGHGFGGRLEREMSSLVQLYPSLRLALVEHTSGGVSFQNPARSCYFLEDDRQCRIQRDHGYELKPGVCVLFPFTNFRIVGTTALLRPHFLCPLRVILPADPASVEGSHAKISEAAEASGLLNLDDAEAAGLALRLPRGVRPDAILQREARVRDACAEALRRTSLLEVLSRFVPDRTAFDENYRRCAELLDLPEETPAGDGRELEDILLAVLPGHRVDHLTVPDALWPLMHRVQAGIVRACTSLRRAAPQDVYSVLEASAGLARLLAWGSSAAPIHWAKLKPGAFTGAERTFAAFRFQRAAAAGKPVLDAIENALAEIGSPLERVVFLRNLAEELQALEPRPRAR